MKKRLLIVEHDPFLLQTYTGVAKEEPDRWDVAATSDARQALELMDRFEFDVVVSDLRMPGISPVELIEAIKIKAPRASRIVVSDISDHEETTRHLNSVHQFLAKPFEMQALKSALARIRRLNDYLQDPQLKTLIGQFGALPSLPSLYVRIMKELGEEDPSVDRAAKIISEDPAMTARVLQIANSAVLGLARRIGSPFEAIQYLGFGTVRSLVLSAHIFSCFQRKNLKGLSFDHLWSNAIRSSGLARMIMELENFDTATAEDATIAGMLHDVGELMIVSTMPAQYHRARKLSVEQNLPFHEAEMAVYGATHAGAAAYLLGMWGLPTPIVEAVAFHHTPDKSEMRTVSPLTAVHVADAFAWELSAPESRPKSTGLDTNYLTALGLQDRLEVWRAEFRNHTSRQTRG